MEDAQAVARGQDRLSLSQRTGGRAWSPLRGLRAAERTQRWALVVNPAAKPDEHLRRPARQARSRAQPRGSGEPWQASERGKDVSWALLPGSGLHSGLPRTEGGEAVWLGGVGAPEADATGRAVGSPELSWLRGFQAQPQWTVRRAGGRRPRGVAVCRGGGGKRTPTSPAPLPLGGSYPPPCPSLPPAVPGKPIATVTEAVSEPRSKKTAIAQ